MAVAKTKPNSTLLDILVSAKLVTEDQAKYVREVQQRDGSKVKDVLLAESLGGIFKKCVTSQAVYPLSEQDGLEAQERR